ncbi:LptF/LptG family permease [Pannus brasiliensis CCIBt3594]|uniref:LptF/LptG family permease n=1 Tax=Pannus brasiliensis CCIBt3594 TaxID=1427578 RepID=A0AAW9QY98_9CHRO
MGENRRKFTGKYKFARSGNGGISLLDRYLIAQLLPPFLFGVGLFASLGVAIGNLSDLANKIADSNLPLMAAIEILLLKVPEFVTYSLPVSLLLATLLTYGRLGSDSELTAFRSCGCSLYRLLVPTLCLSFFVTGITLVLNEYVVPASNFRATEILVRTIQEERDSWQDRDIYYPNYDTIVQSNGKRERKLKSLLYAETFDGKNMKSVTVLRWSKQKLQQIIIAESATWNPIDNLWDFTNGTIYQLSPPDASYGEAVNFQTRKIPLSRAAFDFAVQSRDPYEMNLVQAIDYLKLLKLGGDEKRVRMFKVRIHQKIAFPFVCVVFGLIGATLGSLPRQIDRGTGFGLSVAIIFTYYLINFLIGSLGVSGVLPPFLAAWIPNFFGLLVGGWLAWRVNG